MFVEFVDNSSTIDADLHVAQKSGDAVVVWRENACVLIHVCLHADIVHELLERVVVDVVEEVFVVVRPQPEWPNNTTRGVGLGHEHWNGIFAEFDGMGDAKCASHRHLLVVIGIIEVTPFDHFTQTVILVAHVVASAGVVVVTEHFAL